MKVTIHGPNLRDQSKGQFHIHEATCRDNARVPGSEHPWTVEVDDRLEVVEDVYHDQLNEQPYAHEEGTPGWENERDAIKRDWLDDFHFAPCTSDLPFEVEGDEADEDERSQQLADAGGEVAAALEKLYRLHDGDEAAVGEALYEIDKVARINAQFPESA